MFMARPGTGKSHLLNALRGYTACEKGISVRFARVVDMINTLSHDATQRHAGAGAPAIYQPVTPPS